MPAEPAFGLERVRAFFRKPSAPEAAAAPAPDETTTQSRAIDAFLARLDVAPVRNSRLVDIKYRLGDPGLAQQIVNALGQAYIAQTLEFKFTASKQAGDWLEERLAEQRKIVEAAEARLQQYREQHDAIVPAEDRQNIVVQKLADLNAAVTRAKTERIQKEAAYDQIRAARNAPGGVDTFPAILTNSFIQQQKAQLAELQREFAQLSEKLGEKHPEIIKVKSALQTSQAKLSGEIEKVVQSVKTDYLAALAQERSLTAALDQQKTEALGMNRKAIEYGVLERDTKSSRQIYDSLMQRAKETGVSAELKTSNISVIDRAETPRSPVEPRLRSGLAFGAAGALLFAVCLTFFFEYFDNRIKTPEEIQSHLGVASLGLIPAVRVKGGASPALHRRPPGNFAEAIRTIRTNVLFGMPEAAARCVLVTSTAPGEGKSVIASNLAMSLAHSGSRVLLIDADMRKPRGHELLGAPKEPGLSNVIVGDTKLADAVRRTPIPGLWLLTAGKTPPNPAELLGSDRFRDLLLSLETRFDWIVIDSAPIMAVADASVMAHRASGVLFVVGSEMTSRHAALKAVEQLIRCRGRIIGAVLNRVALDRDRYYYSHYYSRDYQAYYRSERTAS
jgi:polysaccharide biosynthesis transport protein